MCGLSENSIFTYKRMNKQKIQNRQIKTRKRTIFIDHDHPNIHYHKGSCHISSSKIKIWKMLTWSRYNKASSTLSSRVGLAPAAADLDGKTCTKPRKESKKRLFASPRTKYAVDFTLNLNLRPCFLSLSFRSNVMILSNYEMGDPMNEV